MVYSAQNRMVWSSKTAQDWDAVDLPNILQQPHVYFLKNVATGFHLCSQERSVYARPASGTPAEKWVRRELGNGYFALYNVATARRLDSDDDGKVYASPGGDGNNINNNKYQQWTFERSKSPFIVRNVGTQLVLEGNTYQAVYTDPPNNRTSQDWELTKTTSDESAAADSLKQMVRELFEKSLNSFGDREYRVAEPPAAVDVLAENSSSLRVYVRTTMKYIEDFDEFDLESSDFFEASEDDSWCHRMIISSEGISREVSDELERRRRAQALTIEQLTHQMLFFNGGH